MKVVRPVIALNRVPYLKMILVGSHSTLGRENEGKMERTRRSGSIYLHVFLIIFFLAVNYHGTYFNEKTNRPTDCKIK